MNDINVGVLIGANCSKATELVEVTAIQKEIPHTFRRLLRWCMWQFLQRKDGNLNKQSMDFQISCHVIRGVSSPSCNNYALKKTVMGN